MALSEKQKKHLKGLAHHLKPVVMLGQHGLTDAVIREMEVALAAHELIKVRVTGADREEKAELIAEMAERTGAEHVQTIGHVAVFFLRNPDRPRIVVPS